MSSFCYALNKISKVWKLISQFMNWSNEISSPLGLANWLDWVGVGRPDKLL